jgi:hypothetical protein
MAKISIHIPDGILAKVRQHKDRMNISKVCSTALLKEVEVISSVPPLVDETRRLIERLRKDVGRQQLESVDLGTRLAKGYLPKLTMEQLRYWGSLKDSERNVVLPEEIEDYIERISLEKKISDIHRQSLLRGWSIVMKRTWETVRDRV